MQWIEFGLTGSPSGAFFFRCWTKSSTGVGGGLSLTFIVFLHVQGSSERFCDGGPDSGWLQFERFIKKTRL